MAALPLTFAKFYPRYLREHSRRGTRVLHFVGTTLFLACVVMLAVTGHWGWLPTGIVAAYGFAWVGHFLWSTTGRLRSSTRGFRCWATSGFTPTCGVAGRNSKAACA